MKYNLRRNENRLVHILAFLFYVFIRKIVRGILMTCISDIILGQIGQNPQRKAIRQSFIDVSYLRRSGEKL